MNAIFEDLNVVGEVEGTLFELIAGAPSDTTFILRNVGSNTMNYRFQYWDGGAWQNAGADGSELFSTINADGVKTVKLTSNYQRIRLLGNASGGASLLFHIARHVNRAAGGQILLA